MEPEAEVPVARQMLRGAARSLDYLFRRIFLELSPNRPRSLDLLGRLADSGYSSRSLSLVVCYSTMRQALWIGDLRAYHAARQLFLHESREARLAGRELMAVNRDWSGLSAHLRDELVFWRAALRLALAPYFGNGMGTLDSAACCLFEQIYGTPLPLDHCCR